MKWKPGKRNPDLEDRRGQSQPAAAGASAAAARRLPDPDARRQVGGGIGTILIIIVLFFVLRGCGGGDGGSGSGFDIPGLPGDQTQVPAEPETGGESSLPEGADPEANQVEFVNFVLTDLEAFWTEQFQGTQNHAAAGPRPLPPGGRHGLRRRRARRPGPSTARSTRRPTST